MLLEAAGKAGAAADEEAGKQRGERTAAN